MAESLRDLVVSLSLNTDNFTRNIRSVQRQIQEAQSEFQLAAAGVQNFEQTTEGLNAKLSSLERTLSLQADAVGQYEKALSAARDKLQECYDRQVDYAQRLSEAKQKQSELAQEIRNAQTAYENYRTTLGETDSATIAAKQNLDALEDEYKAASDEVKKLEGQNTALEKSTQNAADAVSAANVKLNQANAAMRTTQSAIDQTNQELALAQTQWRVAGEAISESRTAIATIGKQMQQAESRFRLATASIKDMDTSADGLAAKMTLLREKIMLQEKAVVQYEAALEAAKQQLEAAQQANDPAKIRQASDAVIEAQTGLNNAKASLASLQAQLTETGRQLQTARSAWTAAGKSLAEFGDKCTKVGQTMADLGRTLSMYVTTPITTLAATAVKSSIDFESAFTDVRKVTDATEEEFTQLSGSIKQMSTELASSTTEIAGVVTSASRLGIATDDLMDFTKVMIDLGNSTDMTADDAATSIARFANIMGMSSDNYENLGSTLVALGNNYATTESEIMEMSLRLAGAGRQVGLSESQILAFSAALSSVGIEAQMGGSSMSKALIKMEVASAEGGQALDDFGKVCGMTGAQFKTLWDADPAAAFQSFIVGLSKMDDEGTSAIAVLDDIGISEIRLRDTLLRATNATELFSNTQKTASSAWQKNTELASVAQQRYNTTASKLTNLKNSAMLFAQTLGDDLNPMIRSLIEGAEEIIDRLSSLDSSQRMQILQWAALAAAAGPALLVFGNVTKTIGTVSKGIGTFATAVGKAGGGFSGFMKVLTSSPAVWFAVAAAVVVATAAVVDYASGARQAREALNGMKQTAEDWKNTSADTFYGSSKGLSFFGLSADSFTQSGSDTASASQKWFDRVIEVWSDGKRETSAVITELNDSWKTLTADTREELTALQSTADAAGYTGFSSQLKTDLSTLDDLDRQISSLLRKRKGKKFTEEDQQNLQNLIGQRDAIEIRYRLVEADADSFETIAQKIQAEAARAQARGQTDADVSVYQNAVVAAAQGMAALTESIDAQYDSEYAVMQLMEDEGERQQAQNALDEKYLRQRQDAAHQYAELLSSVVMPVWNMEEMRTAGSQIDSLTQLLTQFGTASHDEQTELLTQMEALSGEMDEGSLTEYISLLTQIQSLMDSGMSEAEVQAMFPEIDFSTALEQIASIQQFLNGRSAQLPGLTSMFGEALPEEIVKIAADLDLTAAQARWTEFASNPGAITTEAVISGFGKAEEGNEPKVEVFVSKYTEVPEGADKSALTPAGLLAYVSAYAQEVTGADVSGITPQNITAMVSAYQELASGADVSTLKPEEITAYISSYAKKNEIDLSGITPEGITAFVLAYEEVSGGALTTALTPTGIAAMVTKYMQADGIDLSSLTEPQIEAVVTAFAEAANCDKSALKAEVVAQITAYEESENVVKPSFVTTQLSISGYDLSAYRRFLRENPVEVSGIVRLSALYDDPSAALTSGASFWQDGVEVPAEMVPKEQLRPDTVAVLAEDGTMHVLITPEITGSQEALTKAEEELSSTAHRKTIGSVLLGDDTLDDVSRLSDYLTRIKGSFSSLLNFGGWMNDFNRNAASATMDSYLDMEEIGNIQSFVSEAIAAINSGGELSEDTITDLQEIQNLVSLLDAIGIGGNVTAGIAEGMTAAGWDSSAETVASDLETAINTAMDIHSPSGRMKPTGEMIAAGIAEGMTGYSFTSAASSVGTSVENSLSAAMPNESVRSMGYALIAALGAGMQSYSISSVASSIGSKARSGLQAKLSYSSFRSIGVNVALGLAAGIRSGTSSAVSAARAMANAVASASKKALAINSPSRVFRDEIGVMAMKGFGEGILRETPDQAKIISNASRYLADTAKDTVGSSSVYTRTTNHYDNSSSGSLNVGTMNIGTQLDISLLNQQLAALTKKKRNGYGY